MIKEEMVGFFDIGDKFSYLIRTMSYEQPRDIPRSFSVTYLLFSYGIYLRNIKCARNREEDNSYENFSFV
jgi:hypothetical protein